MQLEEKDLQMIQIDGSKRHVYLKFQNPDKLQAVLQETGGKRDYKPENGEISRVQIEPAGMGIRTLRIAILPPEVTDNTISSILSRYGEVKGVKEEKWSRTYRYKIPNGIRLVTLNLRMHIPSYLNIENNRVLLSYEGQPITCYGCGTTGHLYQECPARLNKTTRTVTNKTTTWATVIQQRNETQEETEGNTRQQEVTIEGMDTAEDNEEVSMGEDTRERGERITLAPKSDNNTVGTGGVRPREQEEGLEKQPDVVEGTGREQAGGKEEGQQEQKQEPTTKRRETIKQTHRVDRKEGGEEEQRLEGEAVQRNNKVRGGSPPTTTSDEDMTINKPQTSTKRPKKQKTVQVTGTHRDRLRSEERKRKNPTQ
jgi:hypothetical protein